MQSVLQNRSKFRHVVDELVQRIYNGAIAPGCRLYSRQELCEQFGISPMTAHRVQSELKNLGLLTGVPGQGFLVNATSTAVPAKGFQALRRVVTIGGFNAIGPGTGVGEAIMRGVAQVCNQFDLIHQLEYVDVLEHRPGFINTTRSLAPDEGLALFLGPSLLPEVLPMLMGRGVRASLINETLAGRASVLMDNRFCIRSILDELARLGKKSVVMASYFNSLDPNINESELLEAFEEFAPQRFQSASCSSGNYRELLSLCRQCNADAVIFMDVALACRFLREQAADLPDGLAVAGCTGHAEGLPEYAQVIANNPDYEEMGRAAVRQLLEYRTPFQVVRNIRVRGKLKPCGIK